jgi:hypothetical protein
MEQTTNSLKYYIVGAVVVLIAVVGAIVMVRGNAASVTSGPQSQTSVGTSNAITPGASDSSASVASPFVGTWTSATPGKGIEATGKVATPQSSTQITLAGDVTVVVQKVEKDTAYGTISYSKVCLKSVMTATGKAPVTQPPRCIDAWTEPFQAKVLDDTFSYEGSAQMGSTHTIKGKVSGDTFSGTFIRSSVVGDLNGTFAIVRAAH